MSQTPRKHVLVAVAAIAGVGAVTAAIAQPPEFVRAEQQRKAFVRAEASSKASRPVQPATEAQAVQEMKVLPGGVIEIPLPEDRMLYVNRVVDAQGKVHVGHVEPRQSAHTHAPAPQEKHGDDARLVHHDASPTNACMRARP